MRFLSTSLLLWALAIVGTAAAQEPACLLHFANAAGPLEDPAPLVRETYCQLIDTLGAGLTPDHYRKIVEGGDPFGLPEEAVRETGTLGKRLGEFRKLMVDRGWDTPLIRMQMLTDLGTRVGQVERSQAKAGKLIEEKFGDHNLPFPVPMLTAVRPDGKIFGFPYEKEERAKGYYVYDPATKHVTFKAGKATDYTQGWFSSDGHELFVPIGDHRIVRIPVEGDELRLDQAKKMPKASVYNWMTGHAFPQNPNFMFAGRPGLASVARFDLTTGKSVKLDLDRYTNGRGGIVDHMHDWGAVPGTDHLWMVLRTSLGAQLHIVSISPTGQRTNVATRENLAPKNVMVNSAKFLPEGKGFAYCTRSEMLHSPDGQRKPETLLKAAADSIVETSPSFPEAAPQSSRS